MLLHNLLLKRRCGIKGSQESQCSLGYEGQRISMQWAGLLPGAKRPGQLCCYQQGVALAHCHLGLQDHVFTHTRV